MVLAGVKHLDWDDVEVWLWNKCAELPEEKSS